MLIGSTLFP